MANSDDSGVAPIRRDAVVASDLIAVRELLKAETQAVHQLAQTAIAALDEKMVALTAALTEKVEALNKTQDAKLEAMSISGWQRIKDADTAARERVLGLEKSINDQIIAIYSKLATMNEIREQLNEQARTFATRDMFESIRSRIEFFATREMVDDLRGRMDLLASREALEATLKTRETRFSAAESRLTIVESFMHNIQGRMWAMGALIFFGAIVLNLVLRFMFEARGAP